MSEFSYAVAAAVQAAGQVREACDREDSDIMALPLFKGGMYALTNDVGKADGLKDQAEQFIAHYAAPPESVARVAGPSYHAIGLALATIVMVVADEAAMAVARDRGEPCGNLFDVMLPANWPPLRHYVRDRVLRFNASWLIAMIHDEAVRAERRRAEAEPSPADQTKEAASQPEAAAEGFWTWVARINSLSSLAKNICVAVAVIGCGILTLVTWLNGWSFIATVSLAATLAIFSAVAFLRRRHRVARRVAKDHSIV